MKQMPQKQTARKPRHRNRTRSQAAMAVVRRPVIESDGTYFLKLVVIVILGTLWLKMAHPLTWQGIPFGGFPVGLIVGLAGIVLIEKNQTDRKIWYAVLIVVTIICYFVPAGIII